MSEKLYKVVKGSGAAAIVTGVVTLVAGISCGVMMIITGARLLAAKSDTLF